jgi:hypothetical protein
MINPFVHHYTQTVTERFSELFPRLGYSIIEQDMTSDGQWKGNSRDFGKVAFWQEKDKEGIVINPIKVEDSFNPGTSHANALYIVGKKTFKYLKQIMKDEEISFDNRPSKQDIVVNGRKIKAYEIFENCSPDKLLENVGLAGSPYVPSNLLG